MQLPPMPSACQGCSDRGPVLVPMTLFSGPCPGVRPPALALPRNDLRHLQLEAKQSRGQPEDWGVAQAPNTGSKAQVHCPHFAPLGSLLSYKEKAFEQMI